MKEIEVKVRAQNFDKLLERLQAKNITLSDPIHQEDRIFIRAGTRIPTTRGAVVLRIRTQNSIHTFNLKQQGENEMDNIEYETDISNLEALEKIITTLGYELLVEIKKTRRKAHFQGLELCLDEVEGLGNFVEIEKLAEEADSKAVQKELLKILESLGLNSQDQVWQGYDTQLYLKNK